MFCDLELSRKLEYTEGRSNADFVDSRRRLEPGSGAEWRDFGGTLAMFDGVGSPLTQTFGLGMSGEDDHQIEEIEAFFHERGADIFHEVSPLAPPELLTILGERGYRPIELTSVMFREIDGNVAEAENEISCRQASSDEADAWAEVAAAGWASEGDEIVEFLRGFGRIAAGTVHGSSFVAELDGVPIATGGLNIFDDVALLAGASTLPEFRGRGAQNALFASRLSFARERGCRIAMICAAPGSASQKNAERNGFRIAYTRTKWHCARSVEG